MKASGVKEKKENTVTAKKRSPRNSSPNNLNPLPSFPSSHGEHKSENRMHSARHSSGRKSREVSQPQVLKHLHRRYLSLVFRRQASTPDKPRQSHCQCVIKPNFIHLCSVVGFHCFTHAFAAANSDGDNSFSSKATSDTATKFPFSFANSNH